MMPIKIPNFSESGFPVTAPGREIACIAAIIAVFAAAWAAAQAAQGLSIAQIAVSCIEPCASLCFLARKDLMLCGRLFLVLGSFAVWTTQSFGIAPQTILASDSMALWHIASSRIAKVCALAAIIAVLCRNEKSDAFFGAQDSIDDYWRAACRWIGLTIVLGMIWACGASDWGAFWQWDYIELSELTIFLAAFAGTERKKYGFWAVCIAFLMAAQWLFVYQLPHWAAPTRHQYAAAETAAIGRAAISIAAMAAFVAVGIGVRRLAKGAGRCAAKTLPAAAPGGTPSAEAKSIRRDYILGIALSGIQIGGLFISEDISDNSALRGILCVFFGAIFVAILRPKPRKYFLSMCFLGGLCMFGASQGAEKTQALWINADGAADDAPPGTGDNDAAAPNLRRYPICDALFLHGMRAENSNNAAQRRKNMVPEAKSPESPTTSRLRRGNDGACQTYDIEIGIAESGRGAAAESDRGLPRLYRVSFETCRARTGAPSNRIKTRADAIYDRRIYRLSAGSYDARSGALVFVRDRTVSLVWMLFFLSLCAAGFMHHWAKNGYFRCPKRRPKRINPQCAHAFIVAVALRGGVYAPPGEESLFSLPEATPKAHWVAMSAASAHSSMPGISPATARNPPETPKNQAIAIQGAETTIRMRLLLAGARLRSVI